MSSDTEGHVLVSDTVLMDRDGSVEDRREGLSGVGKYFTQNR